MVKNEAIEEFVQAIQQPQAQSGTTYSAIVARIDDEGVVWVNLAGSNKETPTASVSSEVEKGDSVTVEWRNNKLYIAGNYSNPSAGTARVSVVEKDASIAKRSAEQAVNEAVRAYEAAEQAVYDAGRAAEAAESAEANALASAQSASSAQQSASSAGISASQAQAASEAAEIAANLTITTDTIHYLATSAGSGVTRQTAGWTTSVQTVTATNRYLWTYHTYTKRNSSTVDTDPVITGVYGERGQDGTSVTILGSYDTLAELQAAHPTGSLGDAYMVGGDLYVWNGSAWENVGQIQGPQGPQGIQGNSITILSIAYAVTATEDAPLTYPYSTVPTVPEGSWLWTKTTYSDGSAAITKAKQGKSGTNGTNGTNGRDGTDGEDGVSVTEVVPQYGLSASTSTEPTTWSYTMVYNTATPYVWTREEITFSDSTAQNPHIEHSDAVYNQALTDTFSTVTQVKDYFWHDALGAHVLSDKNTVSGTRYRTDIKGAGLEIFELDGQNDVSVAKFGGSEARVGKTAGGHTTIQTSGMQIYGSDGTKQLANIGYGDGKSATGTTAQAPYYTFGTRKSGYDIGNYSFVEGTSNVSSGYSAHAEGFTTTATGNHAHAEGNYNTAEGNHSHAEGQSNSAVGLNSHVEGVSSVAHGEASHAQNRGTRAYNDYQTAMGQYNQYGNVVSATYALIIGNGTDDNNRSNALAVTWDGNVHIDLADYTTPTTTDKKIYDALYSLEWLSEVTA